MAWFGGVGAVVEGSAIQVRFDLDSPGVIGWQIYDPLTGVFLFEGEWVETRDTHVEMRLPLPGEDGPYRVQVAPVADRERFILIDARVSSGKVEIALPRVTTAARRQRFITAYGLTAYDASLLTSSKPMAGFFEETVRLGAPAKAAANWILGDFSRLLNADRKEIEQSSVKPAHLQQLIQMIDSGVISGKMAKETFEVMYREVDPGPALTALKGSSQISGDAELEAIADQVISENAQSVADFKAGKERALKFLIGQGMKISKGRANPQRLEASLREKIS